MSRQPHPPHMGQGLISTMNARYPAQPSGIAKVTCQSCGESMSKWYADLLQRSDDEITQEFTGVGWMVTRGGWYCADCARRLNG